MAKKKRSRDELMGALGDLFDEFFGDDDEDGGETTLTLRGDDVRRFLGIHGDDPGKPDEPGNDDKGDEPDPEPAPQRTQSRYFKDE